MVVTIEYLDELVGVLSCEKGCVERADQGTTLQPFEMAKDSMPLPPILVS